MIMRKIVVTMVTFLLFFHSCSNTRTIDNTLSKQEVKEGWLLLFDGTTTLGWRGYNQENLPQGWMAKDATLMSSGQGGDIGGDIIFEKEEFCNFEMKLDWKISAGGNSGILYNAAEGEKYHAAYETAPEYQLIDDIGFPQKLEEWQQTGADYAMYTADSTKKILKSAGEWNTARIVFDNGHVEHWLNGKKIVEFEAWTADWNAAKMGP